MAVEVFGAEDTTLIRLVSNEKIIREYIKNQLQEDYTQDQMTLKEYIDPFTGKKNNKA